MSNILRCRSGRTYHNSTQSSRQELARTEQRANSGLLPLPELVHQLSNTLSKKRASSPVSPTPSKKPSSPTSVQESFNLSFKHAISMATELEKRRRTSTETMIAGEEALTYY